MLGAHRHTPAYRMAAGSIAETVVGNAPCAVLTVKPVAETCADEWVDPPNASAALA